MNLKIKKNIPLIDQHDKNFMYGGKFGGNFIPETLKKPIDDLTNLFSKLRKDKKFLKERNHYFKNLLSFLNFANKFVRSFIGFFKVSGIKFPPNFPPYIKFLSC